MTFSPLDWIVLAAYFALLVASGIYLSRRQKGTEDSFLANRNMPVWAVAISVLASALSAATFLGAPQQAYAGNLTYLSANIGVIIATLIVAFFFIPAFYRHNVTTVYELLERRMGRGAKLAGSWAFMAGRVAASGARVYIAAHALSFIIFGDLAPAHLAVAVWLLMAVGVLYTIMGGIETVIWTDVVQTAVFIIAVAAAAALLLSKIPASTGDIVAALANPAPGEPSKLRMLDLALDSRDAWLTRPYTLWTALTGVMLLNLAALGADHDLVQRMLTCRSAMQGSKSVILSTIISIPTVLLFMIVGLLLWAFYVKYQVAPLPQLGGAESKYIFLWFVTHEMPPGLSGLMIAGLFAVGLGSLDSALNAMSATFVNDVYRPKRPGRDESHYLLIGRIGIIAWSILLGGFATASIWWQRGTSDTFIDFALKVMTYAYSGLLGVFLAAIFTKRGSSASAVSAIITGFLVVLALEPALWERWTALLSLAPAVTAFKLAWPWQMFLGTGAALAVALCGSNRRPPRFAP